MNLKLPQSMNIAALADLQSDLGLQTEAGKEALVIALENVILLDKKQQDYGSSNISKFGVFGVIVRLSDKIERLKNLKTFAGLSPEQKQKIRNVSKVLKAIAQDEHRVNVMECIAILDENLDSLRELITKRRASANNESIKDTFRDTSNYSIIALLLELKRWPNE